MKVREEKKEYLQEFTVNASIVIKQKHKKIDLWRRASEEMLTKILLHNSTKCTSTLFTKKERRFERIHSKCFNINRAKNIKKFTYEEMLTKILR